MKTYPLFGIFLIIASYEITAQNAIRRFVYDENILLNDEDFMDDAKDAVEIGAGHTVTALYEIIPTGIQSEFMMNTDELNYHTTDTVINSETVNIKIRHKKPFEKAVFNKVTV